MTVQYSSFRQYYVRAKDGLEVKSKDKEMRRVLSLFQLSAFGISAIVGGGIFVVTGVQAKFNAGPAIMLAYLISGAIATLTALCYAEFASEVVITGGAFAYATLMYGKFVGWMVGANTMLEYLLASSTVAKGFASYFTTLIGQPSGSLQFCVHACDNSAAAIVIDPIALATVVILTTILVFGVKESFWFNAATVVVSMVAILLCIFLGAPNVNRANYTEPNGFLPFGFNNVIKAASSVFFAYVGFDMIANAAEEARNPRRDVPLATAFCLGLCTALYAAASTVITGLVPYYDIDSNAPFSVALGGIYPWASYIVSVGACAGTFNSAFAALYAMSRLMVVLSRCRLIPEFLARVSPRTESPVVATILCGGIIAVLAFFVPLEVLADLVSMGTLFAFGIVTLSVAVRARYVTGAGIPKWRLVVPCALVVIGSCMIGFSYYYQAHWGIILAGGLLWIAGTLMFCTLPRVYHPEGFKVPLNPFLPCLGTLANIFLIGSLGPMTWLPWLGAMVLALLVFAANGWYQHRTWWRKGGSETHFLDVDAVTSLPSMTGSHTLGGSFQRAVPPDFSDIGTANDAAAKAATTMAK
ncbi:amino acid permease-domain-containing protein [Scenedesmus sp. NREL 46B-D3]|nr:amino acid permease-domain-containing protein [Scenedesmus sp. NREL 46B-D3]